MEKVKITKKRIAVFITITILSVLLIISVSFIYVNQKIYEAKLDEYQSIIYTLRSNVEKNKPSSNASIINQIDSFVSKYYKGEEANLKIEQLINLYLDTLNDPYAHYYTKDEWDKQEATYEGQSFGIGVQVLYQDNTMYVTKVFKDSPADVAGIKTKDIITGTKDVSFSDLSYSECLALIKGDKGTKVTLAIKRDDKDIQIEVERNDYAIQTVYTSFKEENSKLVGIIQITNFYEITVSEFKNAINECIERKCSGIVFDVRENPGGLLASVTSMLDMLLPEGPIVHINYKDEESSYTISSDEACMINVPFAVLANQDSASAAELFTSTLKDYQKAIVIGTKTYGKGCGQTMFTLSNGGVIKFTTFLYDPPYSSNYNGIGIVPDIEIEIEDLISSYLLTYDEDTQLQKAIEELTK